MTTTEAFQIKPDFKNIKERVKLLQQGRFVIIRFDVVNKEPSFIFSSKGSPEKKQKENFVNIDDDLLSQFLPQESKKMNDKQEENLSKLNTSDYSSTTTQKEALVIEKEDKNKNEHVEMSVVPLVDQIKKGVIVLGVILLMIFGFKKYFLINTRRDIRKNKKKFSPDPSEGRGDKVLSAASKVAREKILQKIRNLKK